MLLALNEVEMNVAVDYEAIYAYLNEQLPNLDIKKIKKHLPRTIIRLKKSNQGLSQDQELGLFMHIACNIQRIKDNDRGIQQHIHKERVISRNKMLYNDIKDILGSLEEAFEINFNDDEIANIISIIKKI